MLCAVSSQNSDPEAAGKKKKKKKEKKHKKDKKHKKHKKHKKEKSSGSAPGDGGGGGDHPAADGDADSKKVKSSFSILPSHSLGINRDRNL